MHQLTVHDIVVDIVRKDIKNLHLGVYPPNGRVRVASPLQVDDEAVRLFIISKLSWIQRQQVKFSQQERQTEREYVSGESHYFEGQRYLLSVQYQPATPHVVLRNNTHIDLFVRPGSDVAVRERVLATWYRQQLQTTIAPLLAKWQPKVDQPVHEWHIKQMKTKWGTCNPSAHRLWFNLELVKKPIHCVEYVIVHELVHLLERHHNERFTGYMNRLMPHWHFYREELNRAPLGHETWAC